MKKVFSVNVLGRNGYSFAVKCDATSTDEVVELALDNDLFDDPEDADCCVVEDITDSEYDQNGLKDCTYEF